MTNHDKQTPPDWVLLEAAKRSKMRVTDRVDPFHTVSWYDNDTFRALCDMIERYEQPPVDRIEELEAALKRIADFGQANPGHGRSCAVIALRALVGDEHD